MLSFYMRMAFNYRFRKCYTLLLLASVLVFHFYYLHVFGNVYDLAVSSAMSLLLFSHKNVERIFYFLQHQKRFFLLSMVDVIMLFVPHLFPLGVTISILLFGTVFYPSRRIRDKMSWLDIQSCLRKTSVCIVEDYHKWQ